MSKSFVDPNNSIRPNGDGVYTDVIKKIQEDGVCPFCPESLRTYHKNPILVKGSHWLATDNMYPYKGAKHQVLFIHIAHIENITEITPPAWAELTALAASLVKERKIPGGAFVMRFGDTRYTGASVAHLHANIVSSDPDNPTYEPVVARIG